MEYPYFVRRIGEEKLQDLIGFIKDYNLQDYQADILFLAFHMYGWKHLGYHIGRLGKEFKRTMDKELYEAHQLIQSRKQEEDIKIIFQHQQYNQKAEITNGWLIMKITKMLKELYEGSQINPAEFTGARAKKKKHYLLGIFSHMLQEYLQAHTYLKLKNGKYVSNAQARFIFYLLEILDMVVLSENTTEEKLIRDYIKIYREGK